MRNNLFSMPDTKLILMGRIENTLCHKISKSFCNIVQTKLLTFLWMYSP